MGGQPTEQPFLLKPGEGDSVWSVNGQFTTKLGSANAGGRLMVLEEVVTAAEAVVFDSVTPLRHGRPQGRGIAADAPRLRVARKSGSDRAAVTLVRIRSALRPGTRAAEVAQ
jgi:hypothetical protein